MRRINIRAVLVVAVVGMAVVIHIAITREGSCIHFWVVTVGAGRVRRGHPLRQVRLMVPTRGVADFPRAPRTRDCSATVNGQIRPLMQLNTRHYSAVPTFSGGSIEEKFALLLPMMAMMIFPLSCRPHRTARCGAAATAATGSITIFHQRTP
jgi:hypothetical protein